MSACPSLEELRDQLFRRDHHLMMNIADYTEEEMALEFGELRLLRELYEKLTARRFKKHRVGQNILTMNPVKRYAVLDRSIHETEKVYEHQGLTTDQKDMFDLTTLLAADADREVSELIAKPLRVIPDRVCVSRKARARATYMSL